MENKIDLQSFVTAKEDYKRILESSVDIRQQIIDNASKRIQRLNEKSAEQALIESLIEENKNLKLELENKEDKHMGDIQIAFEHWFRSIPDVDETLLDDKLDHGQNYTNHDVERMWFAFKAGYARAE